MIRTEDDDRIHVLECEHYRIKIHPCHDGMTVTILPNKALMPACDHTIKFTMHPNEVLAAVRNLSLIINSKSHGHEKCCISRIRGFHGTYISRVCDETGERWRLVSQNGYGQESETKFTTTTIASLNKIEVVMILKIMEAGMDEFMVEWDHLMLPDWMRDSLKMDWGVSLSEEDLDLLKGENVVTVGDVVSLTFRKHGIKPRLSIYDGRTERHEMTEFAELVKDEPKVEIVNPAGELTPKLFTYIRGIWPNKGLIHVDGEEDLAALPCLAFMPIGTKVVYGQSGKGMRMITVDPSNRAYAAAMMASMVRVIKKEECKQNNYF